MMVFVDSLIREKGKDGSIMFDQGDVEGHKGIFVKSQKSDQAFKLQTQLVNST